MREEYDSGGIKCHKKIMFLKITLLNYIFFVYNDAIWTFEQD